MGGVWCFWFFGFHNVPVTGGARVTKYDYTREPKTERKERNTDVVNANEHGHGNANGYGVTKVVKHGRTENGRTQKESNPNGYGLRGVQLPTGARTILYLSY